MATIGKWNSLAIVKEVDFGLYLDGDDLGEILLPRRYAPRKFAIGDALDVFIYLDSEDRLIATTQKPFAQVGEFALLKAVASNSVGVFLDWGLPKDLLVPFREQGKKMSVGKSYIVRVYFDEVSERIVASTKLDKFLQGEPDDFDEDEEVELLICHSSDHGYNVIIDDNYWGLLYKNEVFQKISYGDRIKGFIKKIREDGKIDVCLQRGGFEKVDDFAEELYQRLKDNNGFLPVTDKSPADEIYKYFGVSKKTYKKAVGALYKRRLIILQDNGIQLV